MLSDLYGTTNLVICRVQLLSLTYICGVSSKKSCVKLHKSPTLICLHPSTCKCAVKRCHEICCDQERHGE
jgi:hypothetical protein